MMLREFYLAGPLSAYKAAPAGGEGLRGVLSGLLSRWNGAYAYAGAFVILPSGTGECMTAEELNAGAWKRAYAEAVRDTWFFAVDAVGHPFGIQGDRIVHLDIETGAVARLHSDWGDFVLAIQEKPDLLLRLDLFEAWLAAGNNLGLRQRLAPATPFHKGGGRTAAGLAAEDLRSILERNAALQPGRGDATSADEGAPDDAAPASGTAL